MISSLFDTTITIRRRSEAATLDEYGVPGYGAKTAWTAAYSNAKARIEQKESRHKLEYNESGQRLNTQTKIYVENTTLARIQDAVFDSDNNYIGLVVAAYKAYGPNNFVSHYELDIELK